MTPAVSVLLPVRDGPRLGRAVASLQAQTLREWECVVVDDGSARAVPEFPDPRVRVVRQPPTGLTAALRRGAAEATAPLVARLDADDECLPRRLEAQLALLRSRPELLAVGAGIEGRSYPSDHEGLVRELERLLTPIPHSTLMVRREALHYRAEFLKAQDYDLLLRLSERGGLGSVPEPLVRLGLSPGSVTESPEGGSQFEYCVLAYVCAVCRRLGAPEPLGAPEFARWYRSSSYPALFRSRLSRREARMALRDRRPMAAAAALARATVADPAWPLRHAGADDPAAEARAWARAWAKRRG